MVRDVIISLDIPAGGYFANDGRATIPYLCHRRDDNGYVSSLFSAKYTPLLSGLGTWACPRLLHPVAALLLSGGLYKTLGFWPVKGHAKMEAVKRLILAFQLHRTETGLKVFPPLKTDRLCTQLNISSKIYRD